MTVQKICKCGEELHLFQIAPNDEITAIDENQAQTAWLPTWAASKEDIPRAWPARGTDSQQAEHDIHLAANDPSVETRLRYGACQEE